MTSTVYILTGYSLDLYQEYMYSIHAITIMVLCLQHQVHFENLKNELSLDRKKSSSFLAAWEAEVFIIRDVRTDRIVQTG